jgi:hypothetical protein
MAKKPELLVAASVGTIRRPVVGVLWFFAQVRVLRSQPPCGGR